MTTIPAATPAGKAAKVRALLAHVCHSEWRGPKDDLDWAIGQTRALLGEFAGMNEEELAAGGLPNPRDHPGAHTRARSSLLISHPDAAGAPRRWSATRGKGGKPIHAIVSSSRTRPSAA